MVAKGRPSQDGTLSVPQRASGAADTRSRSASTPSGKCEVEDLLAEVSKANLHGEGLILQGRGGERSGKHKGPVPGPRRHRGVYRCLPSSAGYTLRVLTFGE